MNDDKVLGLLTWGVIILVVLYLRQKRSAKTAFGTAKWADDKALRAAGMLARKGLILGRTKSGKLIRMPQFCHGILCGTPGSGKSVGTAIPWLLDEVEHGSLVCFDMKLELAEICAQRRAAMGQRVILLSPFNGGTDALNPMGLIQNDEMMIDHARGLGDSLVVRDEAGEKDPHWNDKASQVITALIVFVLLQFRESERNLNSVQDLASDPEMVFKASIALQHRGGIAGRLGAQMKTLFESVKPVMLSKEGASVMSVVSRHLGFLDSELVGRAVSQSTFDPRDLKKPGMTVFIQIPAEMLEATKGLLRCWITTLIRAIGLGGGDPVVFLLDEASALGSLAAVREGLVRGRSAGVKMLLIYQSDAQITNAFPAEPTLLYDTCSTQIYLGASSIETADRISRSLGEWTQVVEDYSKNNSRSWHEGGSEHGDQYNRGGGQSYSQKGRHLLKPEEVLTLNEDYLIAFMRGGVPPILAKKLKYYSDPEFAPGGKRSSKAKAPAWWWALLLAAIGVIVCVAFS